MRVEDERAQEIERLGTGLRVSETTKSVYVLQGGGESSIMIPRKRVDRESKSGSGSRGIGDINDIGVYIT